MLEAVWTWFCMLKECLMFFSLLSRRPLLLLLVLLRFREIFLSPNAMTRKNFGGMHGIQDLLDRIPQGACSVGRGRPLDYMTRRLRIREDYR